MGDPISNEMSRSTFRDWIVAEEFSEMDLGVEGMRKACLRAQRPGLMRRLECLAEAPASLFKSHSHLSSTPA